MTQCHWNLRAEWPVVQSHHSHTLDLNIAHILCNKNENDCFWKTTIISVWSANKFDLVSGVIGAIPRLSVPSPPIVLLPLPLQPRSLFRIDLSLKRQIRFPLLPVFAQKSCAQCNQQREQIPRLFLAWMRGRILGKYLHLWLFH